MRAGLTLAEDPYHPSETMAGGKEAQCERGPDKASRPPSPLSPFFYLLRPWYHEAWSPTWAKVPHPMKQTLEETWSKYMKGRGQLQPPLKALST